MDDDIPLHASIDDLVERGYILRQEDDGEAALRWFVRALERDPDCDEALFAYADIMDDLDRGSEALPLVKAFLERHPTVADGWWIKGVLLFGMDEPGSALVAINHAITLDDDNEFYYYDRGRVFFELERYEEARSDFARALTYDPDDEDYRSMHGKICMELGEISFHKQEYNNALDPYHEALKMAKGDFVAFLWHRIGLCLIRSGKPEEALLAFDKAISAGRDSSIAYHNKGLAHYELQQWDAAIAAFQRAVEKDPTNTGSWEYLQYAAMQTKRYDIALAANDHLLGLNEMIPMTWYTRGEIMRRLHRYISYFNDLIRMFGMLLRNRRSKDKIGLFFAESERSLRHYQAALTLYETVLQRFPDNIPAQQGKAEMLRMLDYKS